MYWLVPTFPMRVLHGNRDKVEPPGPNLVKSRDALAEPMHFNKLFIKKNHSRKCIWKYWPFHLSLSAFSHWGLDKDKWLLFCIQHLKGIFLERKLLYNNLNLTEVWSQGSSKQQINFNQNQVFHWRKSISKCHLENGSHLVSASMC